MPNKGTRSQRTDMASITGASWTERVINSASMALAIRLKG